MSLLWALVLAGLAGLVGIAVGYVFRWLLVLGRKGSLELEIKRLMLDAKEEAKKITLAAEKEGKRVAEAADAELKEKERKLQTAEDRNFKREEALEGKNKDLEAEIEKVKGKIEEIKAIKERADKLINERTEALAKAAGLSTDEARGLLMEEIEKEAEGDLMARIQKLEQIGLEKHEKKAREILTTSIHRFGNSVASDVM